jgi:hypothetical protein
VVIAKIDNEAYRNRLLEKIRAVAQSWKNIPFSIVDDKNETIMGSIPDLHKSRWHWTWPALGDCHIG